MARDRLTALSQQLRRDQTKEERKLWYEFLKAYTVKFHRQYVIGNYIVDFYCHKAKLVIELDGGQHYDPSEAEKDLRRTEELEHRGLKVIRFSNLDVLQNFNGVCEAIDQMVQSQM